MPVKHNEGKRAYRKYNIVKKMLRNSYFSSFYIKFVLLFLITGCLYEKYTAYFIRPMAKNRYHSREKNMNRKIHVGKM